MMIVLNTNVLSEAAKPVPEPAVMRWLAGQPFVGIELFPKGKRRAALQAAAEGIFAIEFAGRILPFDFDTAAAQAYPHIRAERKSAGHPLAEADAQIAAIAKVHRAAVATRNESDFRGCGITVINPWTI
jgi:toxin FitB